MDLDAFDAHRERARAFAAREIAPSVVVRDRESRWDGGLFRRMGAAGLLRAGFPLAYGGSDLRALPVAALQVGFGEGSGDAGLALAWWAHTFGAGVPVLRLGSEAQRRRFLPSLGTAESIGALAHAEPPGDPEPTGVRTRARRRGDRWILRGKKTWVVNGPVADLFLVTAVTDPQRGKDGVSAFLVEKSAPGLRIGRRIEPQGLRTATISEIEFDDCAVGEDSVLGAEGSGLTQTHRMILRWQRGCLFAPWIGLMRSLLERSVAHTREHAHLGRPLARSQSIRATLADMKIRHELCRSLQARSSSHLDDGDSRADRDLAVGRLVLAESVVQMTRDAMAIHGAEGLEVDRLAERLHRDATVMAHMGEGSATLRSVIAGSLLGLG